ncbi:MAG: amidohydrolase family protein [Planctomycetota bacterium]|nr:amidohydrolase family protein [Planctomycetota bacterium]
MSSARSAADGAGVGGAPGRLREAHAHIAEHGDELTCPNLSGCTSRDEALRMIAAAVRERGAELRRTGGWLRAVGARNTAWADPRWPTAAEVDEAAEGLPTIVMSFDHHALVAGSAVLKEIGFDADTPDPAGGVIERENGRVTGLLLEAAAWAARRAAPPPSPAQYEENVRAALADLARLGFGEVHDMLASPQLARTLLAMERRGELTMRISLYATHEHFETLARGELARPGDRVRLGGLKIFTDGTLNSRTAHMLAPFREPMPGHERGTPLMSTDEIRAAVEFAASLGFPVAAHAIGDGAVRSVLDAVESARARAPGQRIEHAEFVDERDVPRFAELGVIASLQPCHLLTDVEAIRRFVPGRAERAFPLRELIDSARARGLDPSRLVWLGSDAPIVRPDPEDSLWAAVERRRPGAPRSEAIAPRQAITREEALACFVSAGP